MDPASPSSSLINLIHCIKPGIIAESAAAAIAAETANLASIQNQDGDEDPFLDCDELEEGKMRQ